MAMTHTPGPWKADINGPFCLGGDRTTIDAVSDDGKLVRREVASVLLCTGDGADENPDLAEDLANARLIAAAPDLLAACRAALAYIEHCVEPSCNEGDERADGTIDDGSTPEGNLLRAAIARVTGREVD